jgi:hypothetical protein
MPEKQRYSRIGSIPEIGASSGSMMTAAAKSNLHRPERAGTGALVAEQRYGTFEEIRLEPLSSLVRRVPAALRVTSASFPFGRHRRR